MSGIFSIATIHESNDSVLKERITAIFPGNYYELGRGQWLVAFDGTAQELFTKISPLPTPNAPPEVASGLRILYGTVAFGIGGYYGIASRDLWEWVAIKLGAKIG